MKVSKATPLLIAALLPLASFADSSTESSAAPDQKEVHRVGETIGPIIRKAGELGKDAAIKVEEKAGELGKSAATKVEEKADEISKSAASKIGEKAKEFGRSIASTAADVETKAAAGFMDYLRTIAHDAKTNIIRVENAGSIAAERNKNSYDLEKMKGEEFQNIYNITLINKTQRDKSDLSIPGLPGLPGITGAPTGQKDSFPDVVTFEFSGSDRNPSLCKITASKSQDPNTIHPIRVGETIPISQYTKWKLDSLEPGQNSTKSKNRIKLKYKLFKEGDDMKNPENATLSALITCYEKDNSPENRLTPYRLNYELHRLGIHSVMKSLFTSDTLSFPWSKLKSYAPTKENKKEFADPVDIDDDSSVMPFPGPVPGPSNRMELDNGILTGAQ